MLATNGTAIATATSPDFRFPFPMVSLPLVSDDLLLTINVCAVRIYNRLTERLESGPLVF